MKKNYFFVKTNNHLNNFILKLFLSKTGFNAEETTTEELFKNFNSFIEDKNNIPIFYGILRNCYQLMEKLKEKNHDFLYVDHGYFSKRKDNISNYYRIVKNDRYFCGKLYPNLSEKRYNIFKNDFHENFKKLSLSNKENIIIIPPSPYICNYLPLNYLQWIDNINEKIKKYIKNKNIIIKLKNENSIPLEKMLDNCYLMIHHSSMSSIKAISNCIPVITANDDFFLKKYFDLNINYLINDFKFLEEKITEKYFTIKDLLLNLSFRQFTIEEIQNGFAREKIEYMYFNDI